MTIKLAHNVCIQTSNLLQIKVKIMKKLHKCTSTLNHLALLQQVKFYDGQMYVFSGI